MSGLYLLTIIILVIVLAHMWCCFGDTHEKWSNVWKRILYALTILMVFMIAFGIYGSIKAGKQEWEYEHYSTEYIECLQDNNMINGRRVSVRSGYIGEDLYYQYMVKLRNGGYVANRIKAREATVYYSEDEPRVEWYTMSRKWLFFGEEKNVQRLYIPEGSISDTYNIDLE